MSDTSGLAFPSNRDIRHSPDWDYEQGMTLRDYFAAKALGGMASQYHDYWTPESMAEAAYVLADAMLRARKA